MFSFHLGVKFPSGKKEKKRKRKQCYFLCLMSYTQYNAQYNGGNVLYTVQRW